MDNCKRLRNVEIFGFIVTIPLIFLLHFLFKLTGGSLLAALIAPVNESVWEHTKIIFMPYLFFSILEYFFLDVPLKRFVVAKTAGLLSIIILLITFFYTYSGVLGYNILLVDIISSFVWSAIAYFISYRLICSDLNIENLFGISVPILIILLAAYAVFTFNPPHINLFFDTVGKFYGIEQK